jgi:hypothetical protein
MKNYKNIPQRKALLKAIFRMNKKSDAADLFSKHVIPANDLIDAVKIEDLKPLAALIKNKHSLFILTKVLNRMVRGKMFSNLPCLSILNLMFLCQCLSSLP